MLTFQLFLIIVPRLKGLKRCNITVHQSKYYWGIIVHNSNIRNDYII